MISTKPSEIINEEIVINDDQTIQTKSKSGKESFKCSFCFIGYKNVRGKKMHEQRHKPPGGFLCLFCGERFCWDIERKEHTENKHKAFKCQICKEIFQNSEIYIEHIKTIHNGQNKIFKKCDKCTRIFVSEERFEFHKQKQCGKASRFKCKFCSKYFSNKFILKTHLKIHENKKEFCCSYCGIEFILKGCLQIHERIHTGEKPFKCNVCEKSFSHRQSLITHSSVHTGIKPYYCICCNLRFSCTGNLIAHRKKRPETCGQPHYCKELAKICPRPSKYYSDILTTDEPIKLHKILKVFKVEEQKILINNRNDKLKSNKKKIEEIKTEQSTAKCSSNLNLNKLKKTFKLMNCSVKLKRLKLPFKHAVKKNYENDQLKLLIKNVKTKKSSKKLNDGFHRRISPRCKKNIHSTNKEVEKFNNEVKKFNNEVEKFNNEIILDHFKIECSILESNIEIVEMSEKVKSQNFSNKEVVEIIPEDVKLEILDFGKFELNVLENNIEKVKIPAILKDQNTKANINIDFSNSITDYSDIKIKKKRRKKGQTEQKDNIQTNKKCIKCVECEKKYYLKRRYEYHLSSVHNKDSLEIKSLIEKCEEKPLIQFKCNICEKSYNYKKSLDDHLILHGPEKNLIHKCHHCTKYFASKLDKKNHIKKEHFKQSKCKICNKVFQQTNSLHLYNKCSNCLKITKKICSKYVCTRCGKAFNTSTLFNNHELSNCGKNPIYKCNICNKSLTTAGILKSHLSTHTNELKFKCSHCNKGFNNKYQVIEHERMHTGEKPFKCNFCDKAFSFRNNLFIHTSTHTGIKRYMCNGCGDRFSCISGLKAHWRTHATTCGADSNKSTKPQAYLGFRKGKLVDVKEE